jgi:hypothetical protein
MMNIIKPVLIFILIFSFFQTGLASQKINPSTGSQFITDINTAGNYISSLKRRGDRFGTEFIQPGRQLGDVQVRYHTGTGTWQVCSTRDPVTSSTKLKVTSRFDVQREKMTWQICLENVSGSTIEAGDIRIPLQMNSFYSHDPEETFTRRVFRHSFISGHGSFLFWLPVGGEGSFLVMVPDKDTYLEYFTSIGHDYAWGKGDYAVFIHSKASGEATPGTWRQPHTRLILKPGEKKTYGFTFYWTDSYQGVRDKVYENGGCDVQIVPGMVVPDRLPAKLALRTRNTITAVKPEYPHETTISACNPTGTNLHTYTIVFSRPGENKLTVEFAEGRHMILEFFVTQPIEILIKKRAAFMAEKQQHRDPAQWYNGLFSLWDVRLPDGKNLLGPDNLGGQHPYAVSGSDDPSNSKCMYLSEKNVVYPDKKEIEVLEYFIKNFVWGKHQRTDKEQPYSYGIYGSDNWHANRFTSRDPLTNGVSRPGGPSQCRLWRTFDYTTYFAVYFNMYRIAKLNPHLVKYLDADGYLERAYGTARAFFEVPYNIRMEGGWEFTGWTDWAYKLGNFHEKYVLPLIAALEEDGQQDKADWLRGEWEKKVKYFLYDDPYPWISEMPVDSTAYESTYVIAKYALTHELKPDTNLWYDKNLEKWYSHSVIDKQKHREFMRRQLLANLACRGWLTPAYYYLGSDFRGLGNGGYTLSYMSQMGGWSILDQAIYFEKQPAELIRLGSASMLSSWALVNAGNTENNYGYWYPGKQHDGFVAWGFLPQKHGSEWNSACKNISRGLWPVDGEIDHGLTAGIEAAATVVVDDPLFGWYAYCGELQQTNGMLQVVPRDGVRQKLHVLSGKHRLHITLDADGFKRGIPVIIDPGLSKIVFTLENRVGMSHIARLTLDGLPKGTYQVLVDEKKSARHTISNSKKTTIHLPLQKQSELQVDIQAL